MECDRHETRGFWAGDRHETKDFWAGDRHEQGTFGLAIAAGRVVLVWRCESLKRRCDRYEWMGDGRGEIAIT